MARPQGHKVDERDLRLVATLLANPTMALTELAKQLGMKPSSCKVRKDRLVEMGLLAHIAVVPQKASAWKDIRFLLIKLPATDQALIEAFVKHIDRFPEIVRADELSGRDEDVLLRVEARDGERFDEIRFSILREFAGAKLHSLSVVKNLKYCRLPVEAINTVPNAG